MKNIYHFLSFLTYSLIAIVLSIGASEEAKSQSWVAEAQQSGFIIKKVVSDTTVATGQTFSYTIYFTIPAGATNVTISDQIPASLIFLGHSFTSACGTPTVTAPAVNSMGGTYSLNWASVPNGCTGSFTLSVAFPNGTTCPGASVRNNVCLQGTVSGMLKDFCTPYVNTVATATNPWGINKYPLGAAWQGGNCPYASGNDTITYQICVYKAVGTTGQLNLVNGIVRDTLPVGAQLVSSNCGATQTGNVITWNVGNMSANQPYNTVCCQFKVHYPPSLFPNGTNITNSATLSGQLGSANQPCSSFSVTSNQTCVQLLSLTSGSISKWVYTNRQPGCSGQYLIYVCNTGTTPITVSVLDTLPTQLTNYSLGFTWGLSATLTGGIVSATGTLAPGACGYIYINFTIPQNAIVGSTITNCATLNITGSVPQVVCNSFVVDAPSPKPCVWKEVCNKQTDYTPGSIFRYRLRVQNTGGLPILNSTITDVLNGNLEYIGNPSFYSSNSWNAPCTTTPSNPWTGVNLSYNSGTNTVTALLDTIPATCQNVFYTSCGMYGTSGVPFYFIEFDVKVRDTSALGNIPNHFTLSGGNLGSASYPSNIEHILVVGVVGYNLEKGVKRPADTTYSSSVTTTAGSTVNYQLKLNLSGTAALRHVTFADLLPRNNGTSDNKILQSCGTRGSQFDVAYSSFISSSPSIFSTWNNPALTLANVNSWTPTGAPGASFNIGCGTAGAWSSAPWAAAQKNIASYFGANALGLSGANVQFSASVAPTAKDKETACNTFAASGWTKHLIQSAIPSFQLAGQLESPTACVIVEAAKPCMKVEKFDVKCGPINSAGQQTYSFMLDASSCTPATVLISSPDGTFSPATFTFATSPWTLNSTFTHTSTNNPIKINFTIMCGNEICRDSLFRDLPPCDVHPPSDNCCVKFIKDIGKPSIQTNSSTGFVGLSVPIIAGPTPIKSFTATIVSAQLRSVCGSSVGAWTRIYGDISAGSLTVAPAPGPQLLSVFSREAKWGPGECINWTKGAALNLNMIFPPLSGNFKCRDTLMFSIRYSFTDCECLTCDTVVTYKVVRYRKWLPWDTDIEIINVGHIKGNKILSETPSKTSLIMSDANNGSLWIVSPDSVDNNVVITGVELQSNQVQLAELKNGADMGIVQDNLGFLALDVARGEFAKVDLKFNNSISLSKFSIFVRYIYTLEDVEGTFFTEPIEYSAIVPGAAPDAMGIDELTKPLNVRTYALYFTNSNGYNSDVSAIKFKPSGNMRVLAVGPVNSAGDDTYIIPRALQDGSYLFSTPPIGEPVIESQSTAKPIFITLSNAVDNGTIEFTSYDADLTEISKGTFLLTDPISSVRTGELPLSSDVAIQSIVPNPAKGQVTITYSADSYVSGAKFSITDLLGNEIMQISGIGSTIEKGVHVHTLDLSRLISGSYYITLQTPSSRATKLLSVVK